MTRASPSPIKSRETTARSMMFVPRPYGCNSAWTILDVALLSGIDSPVHKTLEKYIVEKRIAIIANGCSATIRANQISSGATLIEGCGSSSFTRPRWRQVTPPSQDSPFELCRFYPIFSDAQTGRVFLLIEWIPLFRHHNMLEGLEYPRLRIPGEMPSRKRSKPRLMICRSISERLLYEIILR